MAWHIQADVRQRREEVETPHTGFVIPWMLSRRILRWRLAPPLGPRQYIRSMPSAVGLTFRDLFRLYHVQTLLIKYVTWVYVTELLRYMNSMQRCGDGGARISDASR